MAHPSPRLKPGGPLGLLDARLLFQGGAPRRRNCATIVRLRSGRLLLAFAQTRGPDLANDAAVMLSASDDDGTTWSDPDPLYATPGWFSMPMGGFAPITDERLLLMIGRIQVDPSLPGTEPITGWWQGSIASSGTATSRCSAGSWSIRIASGSDASGRSFDTGTASSALRRSAKAVESVRVPTRSNATTTRWQCLPSSTAASALWTFPKPHSGRPACRTRSPRCHVVGITSDP